MLWVFAESGRQARKWLADNAPGAQARVWSGGEQAALSSTQFSVGDRVAIIGDIGWPAEVAVARCIARSPGQISLVRAL